MARVLQVANFQNFGCKVYARTPETLHSKLDPKSQVGIYLGFETHGLGYKVLVYRPELKRDKYQVHIFSDIVCYESLTHVTGAQDESKFHWGVISHFQTQIRWPPTESHLSP
jgi:hypothetical protein